MFASLIRSPEEDMNCDDQPRTKKPPPPSRSPMYTTRATSIRVSHLAAYSTKYSFLGMLHFVAFPIVSP